jgi:hypothetical protein
MYVRMNIDLSVQTSLCCPKHYRAMPGGEADLFKKHHNGKFRIKIAFRVADGLY